jgi:hypothetical protein
VYVPLPPFVVEALEKVERPGHRYFWTGQARLPTGRANWSRYLMVVPDAGNVSRQHREFAESRRQFDKCRHCNRYTLAYTYDPAAGKNLASHIPTTSAGGCQRRSKI